ncbi:MAG: hypothetical protein JW820_19920 [Spirochaetales bacterium]|nr:hypothetical protein [Spirochaetales bacterium]
MRTSRGVAAMAMQRPDGVPRLLADLPPVSSGGGLVVIFLALTAVLPVVAQSGEGPPEGFHLGLLAGVVIDPAPCRIEQAHGAAGVVLGYQGRCAVSLRPALLFNSRSVLVRLPVVLRVPLFGRPRAGPETGRALSFGLIGAAGAGTWTGDVLRLQPLLSAGVEMSAGPLWLSAAATAMLGHESVDLLGDLLLMYLWTVQSPEAGPRRP